MNKIFLTGNLTRDPELRTTQSGFSVCTFGLAVQRRRKVEGQPDVDFFNVTAWRQLGENCSRYLTKGRKVCVIGSLQARTYDAKDGTKRTALEVDADDVEFLSPMQPGDQRSDLPQHAMPPASTSGFPPAETGFTQVDEDELPF